MQATCDSMRLVGNQLDTAHTGTVTHRKVGGRQRTADGRAVPDMVVDGIRDGPARTGVGR